MQIKTKIMFLLCLTGLISCGRKSESTRPITSDEYKIYSVVLDSLYKVDTNSVFILTDSTEPNKYLNDIKIFKDGKWVKRNELDKFNHIDSNWYRSQKTELTNDYNSINGVIYPIEINRIKSGVRINQLTSDSLNMIIKSPTNEGWANFYKIFPNSGGVLRFSRVGFNYRQDQAVLYHSCYKGDLYAQGVYILLYKIKSTWVIKTIVQAWVS